MRVLSSLLVSLLLLGGCAEIGTPKPSSCPAIRLYTLQEEQAVAKALTSLPKDSPVVQFISDYGQLRAETRACQGIK